MAKLRSRMLVPSNGWFFIQNDIKLAGGTFDGTVELIKKHRLSNGIPAGNPEEELEAFTCSRCPTLCDYKTGENRTRGLFEKSYDFLGIYSRWAAKGFETVDQITANARSEICHNCPANKQIKSDIRVGCCGGRKLLTEVMDVPKRVAQALTWPVIKNKSTPADKELYTCHVCGCPNRVSVWVPKDVFQYDDKMTAKFKSANPRCWKV